MTGIGKDKLIFDSSAAAEGDNVGAFLRDAAGDLLTSTLVGADQALDVNVVQTVGFYAEDSAHASGDLGNMALAVRNDAGTSLVSADGDYAPLQVDASGRLRVEATVSTNTEYAEDAAHSSGDLGNFVLAVRNDANTSLVSADGDYAPLQVDSLGRLKVSADIDVVMGFEKAEDSAHSSGDIGGYMLGVRQDVPASSTSADGDYQSLKSDALGRTWVNEACNVGIASAAVSVGTTEVALTASLANRKRILIQNLSTVKPIYIGATGLNTTTGMRVAAQANVELLLGPSVSLFALVSTGTADVRVLEFA